MRMSHKSSVSSADENGCRYSLDIIPGVKANGTRNLGLEGMSFGVCDNTRHDPRDRAIMMAKFPRRGRATKKWAEIKLLQARECAHFGHKFNHHILCAEQVLAELSNDNEYFEVTGTVGKTKSSTKILFLSLQTAELTNVATSAFSKGKREKGEIFVFEEKLHNFTRFIDHDGNSVVPSQKGKRRRSSCSSCSSINEDPHQLLHAFVHFYFCHNHGQKILCNFRGSLDEDSGYVLTTPWVHTVAGDGPHDEGRAGMENVINNHVCNKYCRHLPSMTDMFNGLSLLFN